MYICAYMCVDVYVGAGMMIGLDSSIGDATIDSDEDDDIIHKDNGRCSPAGPSPNNLSLS